MVPMMGAGTQKIEMGRRGDTDYESKKKAAMAQAQQNAFMMGIQDVYLQGAGAAASADRSPVYGDTPIKTTPVMQGAASAAAMAPGQNAGNRSLENPMAQTGFLDGGVSSTILPQTQPEMMGQQALARVKAIAQGMNADPGLNDRRNIMRA